MSSISACVIALNEEEFIKYTLESLEYVVDEIIVVDGGSTDRTLNICDQFNKVKVFHKKWEEDYGAQREFALKQAKGDWIISVDADEILSDEGYLLKEIANKPISNNYHIRYEHFIRDFGHVDATEELHVGRRRFFKNLPLVRYSQKMHELPQCEEFTPTAMLPKEISLYHCGYLKSLNSIKTKYERNLRLSQFHTKEYLDSWYYSHLLGLQTEGVLKTKPYNGPYPQPLKEAFKLP